MKQIRLNLLAIAHDGCMAAASFVLALFLRLGDRIFMHTESFLIEGSLALSALVLLILLYLRAYRHVWRYTALHDLVLLAKAGTGALVIFYIGMFAFTRLEHMPRSVPFIHWMTLMLCLMSARVIWRLVHDRDLITQLLGRTTKRIPVLLIGATSQAELFIRESQRSVDFPYHAIGIVDDDTRQHGRQIHHVRVYGSIHAMGEVIAKLTRKGTPPQRLILTDIHLSAQELQILLAIAQAHHLTLARLPSLHELKAGERAHEIRAVAVEDILGRPQAQLDRPAMQAMLVGKRVLVTGAGGSIGSEMVRQVVALNPAEILLFEMSEYALYMIDQELAELAPNLPRHAVLGDVRDRDQLTRVFAAFQPEIVFHAAAIKHVPLSEQNPDQAVLTNILGSKQVADACLAHGVASMVQISTDKVVNPLSIMGATKRVAEIYCQMLAQHAAVTTRFVTVRFGNVLNSAGSVVPLFQKQIARGGPVTITHPDMVRFFMSISEAVQLVLQAAVLGAQDANHAPIFVLDMGEPVRIEDLACQMIRLAGLRPHEDIPIMVTGLRPGEKLFEELFHTGEQMADTSHASIHLAVARSHAHAPTLASIEGIIAAARAGNTAALRGLIQQIVPEYQFDAR